MQRAIFWALSLVTVSACGYTVGAVRGPAGVRAIAVRDVDERGIDVDAAAMVGAAVRRGISNHVSTRLARAKDAEAILDIDLVGSGHGLAPMADPGVRAAQYVASLEIRGTLSSTTGTTLWRSGLIRAQAPYLSVPDDLEALDGARRRALGQAAEQAAEELLAAMLHGR